MAKRGFGRLFVALGIMFLAIQFYRPMSNHGTGPFPDDIMAHHETPQPVKDILLNHCYDCHSNNTNYPWYTNVQPAGWWMEWHVRDGKKHLNFSEFATYSPKKAAHKMEETHEMVEKREMPLSSYTIIHRDAKLTDEQIKVVADWARELEAKLKPATAPRG